MNQGVLWSRIQVGSKVKIDDVGQPPQDRFRDGLNPDLRRSYPDLELW
jgi:hypothetical protein